MNTRNADVTPGATPYERRQWIKYQLNLRGLSLGDLSRRAGCTRQAAIGALARPYPRFQRAIADELGVSVHVLWPEWYAPDGERIRKPRKGAYVGSLPENPRRSRPRKGRAGRRGLLRGELDHA